MGYASTRLTRTVNVASHRATARVRRNGPFVKDPDTVLIRPSTLRIGLIIGLAAALAGCKSRGLDETGGVTITRSICPAVALPAYTGDVTLFNPPSSRDSSAIDVVATITDLRGACNDVKPADLTSNITFRVLGQRTSASGARDVVLPYFITVMRGGTGVLSKSVGRVQLHFDDGQLRAETTGSGTATVSRELSTLPPSINQRITRRRRAGEADAAVDPMSDPKVRAAVRSASFEVLVGFQLTEDQLSYNARR
jgi:hypothetical protein